MLINTYLFQAGLIGYRIGKFKSLWLISVFYLALCFTFQIWVMILRWNEPLVNVWSKSDNGLVVIYVSQRLVSVLYYYIYKRTAYRLSDPRFYEDSDWLRNEFDRRK
jgi:transmembrane protein 138